MTKKTINENLCEKIMNLQKEIGIDENKIDTIRMIAYSRG